MADLLTFIDIQTQAQTTQQAASTQNNNSENTPGFFDALIAEYSSPEELELNLSLEENAKSLNNEFLINDNLMTFKGGNLFSSSVMEVLTEIKNPENLQPSTELLNNDDVKNLFASLKNSLKEIQENVEQPEVFYNDDDLIFNEEISELINMPEEELNEKLNSLTEDLKPEVKKLVEEIINSIKNGNTDIKSDIAKLSALLNKNEGKTELKISKPENENENEIEIEVDDEDENKTKIKTEAKDFNNGAINAAAFVEVKNADNKTEVLNTVPEKDFAVNENENQNLISKKIPQNLRQKSQTSTHEINNVNSEIKTENNSENVKPENNFNKILENRENLSENQNNFSDGENENQNQNFNQARENFSDNQNSSRSKNNTQKISNESSGNQNEREFSTSTNNRTNSHNNFQSFFEGVLNNRRVSAASPQPLNIRENFNFNQSETLRNGVVNVVRFIRADGVRKANVVIDPPALGRISVELSSTTSGVEASIKVASEQIRQLVQDQLSQLRMNLSEQGVQVAEFTVDVQQDSQQNGRNSQQQNQNDGRNFIGGVDEEDTEDFRIDLEKGLLYWVA